MARDTLSSDQLLAFKQAIIDKMAEENITDFMEIANWIVNNPHFTSDEYDTAKAT